MNYTQPQNHNHGELNPSDKQELWSRNPEVVGRKIAGEYVLVPISQSQVDLQVMYSLNPVGAFLWDELKSPKTQGELIFNLLKRYTATSQQAETDVSRFLTDLHAKSLVVYQVSNKNS